MYRTGFGSQLIATAAPKSARPRLGEIIVAEDGDRWRVYDWIGGRPTTLFVEPVTESSTGR